MLVLREVAMRCPNPECPDAALYEVPGSYAEGVTVCPKCGTTLVAGDEPDTGAPGEMEGEPVEVARFVHRQDAELAQSLLEANDIDAIVAADDCGNAYAGVAPGSIRLLVEADDEERAREVLQAADAGELQAAGEDGEPG
jgi:hypothetical protein